mgnify:CR=1 FL=1
MNPIDIRQSLDPDLGQCQPNTSIFVMLDGKNVHITAAELIKMREGEGQPRN